MTEKQYETNDIVKFDYSEIWRKSDDEMYTDTPLRNDEVVELLNENKQLKQKIYKLCNFIEDKINETEKDLKQAVKAGMSTTVCYSDLDLLEEIRGILND